MANELETPSFGNFSIENTLEMGSQELLNDLMSPETSTSSPEDIKKIDENPPAKKQPEKVVKPKKEEESTEEAKKEKSLAELLLEEDSEEQDEEEPTNKAKKDSEESEEEVEENPYSALAKDLLKLGVFSSEEGEEIEVKTPQEFLDRFNLEKKKGANEMIENFIGQFGEDYQAAFQAIYVKGVDPKEYFGTYNSIQNFADMDLSLESNQIKVIKQAFLNQGMETEDVDAEIERIKNYGDLENTATRHHKALIKKEAEKLQQLEADSAQKLQAQLMQKQQYAKNVQTVLQNKIQAKEFDGIPLNPKLASEIQDFLVTDKYKTPSGETLTEFDKTILDLKRPENHEMKVKVALLLKTLEKDPTLSTIQQRGVTKKTDQLFSDVTKSYQKSKKTESSKPSPWAL